ncbi:dolichyl-diphosphooligosaccharide--protein glycosyltransferase subunit 1A [Phoenix dactylifera]|uniref:Dolichyl-diphosphooligosaccharide--protein glycosyltransferase subunit 1 n=1 Tax=Phoenix dactylifera TaxID=42345 RepID=A0A8B7BWA0_PHODC|nr:dolichyl-diphosphooligosaccharide--protein glycosyltransferase subunit 1A [Phoenix dactylifera]
MLSEPTLVDLAPYVTTKVPVSSLESLTLARSREMMPTVPHFVLLLFSLSILSSTARSDLVISRVDRRIDLTSHIVRVLSSLKVENVGAGAVSEVLLAFPNSQAENLATIKTIYIEGKGKGQGSSSLPTARVEPEGVPPELTFYSVSLPKGLEKRETVTLDVLTVFTRSLKPFPEEITQADVQLVLYQDSAHYLSPYAVKVQTLGIRLPSRRVESYTKYPNTKLVESEIRYGPYENVPALSYSPIVVHFENNHPFVVARELVREIEISHWGNVQVTEHYSLVHGGAGTKGGFSRIDYQYRPSISGASSFRQLIARLPPRAHSIYYRDEIGNISTSHVWGDSRRTQLEIEPRFPIFGGWRTSFTIGYGLPLQDFLFESEGKRVLNITFGCPMAEVVIDNLIVEVVLPEGSKAISVSAPFPTRQWQEVKYSHLDIAGRPVVVLEKNNIVPEHNLYFQVYYKFNNLSLLREPMMLIIGFFFLFIACIVYMHTDMSISKSSASYLAKLQWDEVQATVQQVQNIISHFLAVHDRLEASLRDLSRTGDVQSCKAARKAADGQLKELTKELKPLLGFLQSSPQASQIWPKVEEVVAKEKEMQEKLMQKHSTVVDCFEKKLGGREIENRIASQQQKLSALRQEVDDLLEVIDEI